MMKLFFFNILLISVFSDEMEFPEDTSVTMLDHSNFKNITGIGSNITKPWFIMFWSTWCGECHLLFNTWVRISDNYNDRVGVGAINW